MLIGLDQVEDAGYKFSDGSTLKYLAYADDLCISDHERQGIEHIIKKISEFADRANLTFNTSKCASLSAINSKSRKYVESTRQVWAIRQSQHLNGRRGTNTLECKWEENA